MSLLATVNHDESIESDDTDRIGGGIWDTGVYKCKIAMAYLIESSGGAAGLTLHLENAQGRELRQTIYFTSGMAKGKSTTYKDKKTGERKHLPGFTLLNHLCLLTAGKELMGMDSEKKVVRLWDFESKSEQPTEVEVLVELLGRDVYAAVWKQTVDKNAKGDDGQYHPTGETREENEIEKFFRAKDRMTVGEIKSQELTEGAYIDTWQERNAGQVKDKSTKTPATPAAGFNPAAAKTGTPKPASIFAPSA